MTDKQIIEPRNGFYCIEPCPEIKELQADLKRKEQELEYYKIQFNADTKEMDGYLNEIGRHIESIEYLRNQLRIKEQEKEELKKQLESTKGLVTVGNKQITQSLEKVEDLKNELHSKVEFIQEQRNVIDEYSKEIEMYKKCQGSRASKREEKLKQTLAEIKEFCIDHTQLIHDAYPYLNIILDIINEVENGNI